MIEFQNISKFYEQKKALDGISFTIKPGIVFGIIGPNGAGKTTLIRILNQIIDPSSGQTLVNGKILNDSHVRSFGYLPEERGLYKDMTVRNHLIFLARLRGLNLKEAQDGLNYWLGAFEIEAWSQKKIHELSKGMAQKVQFIAAVLHDPDVIVLDEPLSGFDPLNIHLILNQIQRFKTLGKTVIFSTHNMDSVDSICDEVALIHQGNLVAFDSVSELRSKYKNGDFKIRFRGHPVAFANALWTGFEIIESKELDQDLREAVIRKRGDLGFKDVYEYLSKSVEFELIEERLPSMQEVFVQLIKESDEK